MRRIALALLAALLLAAATAGAGYLWFAAQARRALPPPPQADGIVVLTGAAGRLELGLRLLAEQRAERLLVSGTGRGDLADLIAAAGLPPSTAARIPRERVTLGRDARSTRGNARETADWVQAHALGSLIVVTSGYHMPRALLELRRTLPAEVALRPAPLVPRHPDGHDRIRARLLASEYAKWLGALAGLSSWPARDDESDAAATMKEGG